MGSLAFYGSENGKKSGWARDYYRARDSKEAETDPFAIHLEDQADLKALYADAEHVGESAAPLLTLNSNRSLHISSVSWVFIARCHGLLTFLFLLGYDDLQGLRRH